MFADQSDQQPDGGTRHVLCMFVAEFTRVCWGSDTPQERRKSPWKCSSLIQYCKMHLDTIRRRRWCEAPAEMKTSFLSCNCDPSFTVYCHNSTSERAAVRWRKPDTHAHTVFNKHTNKQTHSLMTDNFLYSVKTNTHTHTQWKLWGVFLFPFLQICEETQENNTLSLSFRRLSNYWLSEQNDCSYLLLLAALDYILYIKLLFFSFTFLVLFRFL